MTEGTTYLGKALVTQGPKRANTGTYFVTCVCGYRNCWHAWSWAGNAYNRCGSCRAYIGYRTYLIWSARPEPKTEREQLAELEAARGQVTVR